MSTNSITNPFNKGDSVVIPKGTIIHSTHPQQKKRAAGRKQTITVYHASNGWVETDRYYGDLGMVKLPTVTWPGAGGYWCDVQLTPELAKANGIDVPELPGQSGEINHTRLDVIPSYDDGYTDRWSA